MALVQPITPKNGCSVGLAGFRSKCTNALVVRLRLWSSMSVLRIDGDGGGRRRQKRAGGLFVLNRVTYGIHGTVSKDMSALDGVSVMMDKTSTVRPVVFPPAHPQGKDGLLTCTHQRSELMMAAGLWRYQAATTSGRHWIEACEMIEAMEDGRCAAFGDEVLTRWTRERTPASPFSPSLEWVRARCTFTTTLQKKFRTALPASLLCAPINTRP